MQMQVRSAEEAAGPGEDLPSPVSGGAAPFFPQAGDALLDDLQLQEHLAFLNEGGANSAHQLPGFNGGECRSPSPGDAGGMFAFGLGWPNGGPAHRRGASVNELCLGGGSGDGFGWKPCLYYARACDFCKYGGSCRFVHGGLPDDTAALAGAKMEAGADQQQQQCQDFLLRSKSQRLGAAAFPYSPTGSLPGSRPLELVLLLTAALSPATRLAGIGQYVASATPRPFLLRCACRWLLPSCPRFYGERRQPPAVLGPPSGQRAPQHPSPAMLPPAVRLPPRSCSC